MFTADAETLRKLEDKKRIAFRYKQNFNGSAKAMAEIIGGKKNNILGMMPYPERTVVSEDFIPMFQNIRRNF